MLKKLNDMKKKAMANIAGKTMTVKAKKDLKDKRRIRSELVEQKDIFEKRIGMYAGYNSNMMTALRNNVQAEYNKLDEMIRNLDKEIEVLDEMVNPVEGIDVSDIIEMVI